MTRTAEADHFPALPGVEAVIEDDRWQAVGLPMLADRAAVATFAMLGLRPDGLELSVLGAEDARIAALNAEFRGKPVPTNVLSWPAWDLAAEADGDAPVAPETGTPDSPEALGDIAIAYDTCAAEAAAQGKTLADHTTHLLVHGLLHCLGYDHERDKDAALMEGLETRILASMGIADPYEAAGDGPVQPERTDERYA